MDLWVPRSQEARLVHRADQVTMLQSSDRGGAQCALTPEPHTSLLLPRARTQVGSQSAGKSSVLET